MMIPTVHLNGTSKDALLDQLTEAKRALYIALGKMVDAAPNGRDYYTQGNQAFSQATLEYAERTDAIRTLIEEYETLIEGVDNQ